MATQPCNRSNHRSRPKHWKWILALAATVPFELAGSPASHAQSSPTDEARWQFSIGVNLPTGYVESEVDEHSPVGFELDLSYRLSRRVGVGLIGIQHGSEDEFQFDRFEQEVTTQTTYRPLWLLAHADFHLTPDHRVDLILSPMVGVVRTGDIRLQTHIEYPFGPPFDSDAQMDTQEDLAWGARLALDIPLGHKLSRSSITVGLTYLSSQVEVSTRSSDGALDEIDLDLDPLKAHVGFAYRF